MTDQSQPHRQDGLETLIKREFTGHGVAVRSKNDELLMPMAEAKELTRRAVAEFAGQPKPAPADPSLGLPKSRFAKYKTSAELDAENSSSEGGGR